MTLGQMTSVCPKTEIFDKCCDHLFSCVKPMELLRKLPNDRQTLRLFLKSFLPVIPVVLLFALAVHYKPELMEDAENVASFVLSRSIGQLPFCVAGIWFWRWKNSLEKHKNEKRDFSQVIQISLCYFKEKKLTMKTLSELRYVGSFPGGNFQSLNSFFYDEVTTALFLKEWKKKVSADEKSPTASTLLEFLSTGTWRVDSFLTS